MRSGEWNALSIGPAGDVYVTGLSRPPPNPTFQPSDMTTARYDNAGVRQWLTTYVGAGNWNDVGSAIVATSDGAVVGGTVHDTAATSVAVIKYGATVLVAPALTLSANPNPAVQGQQVLLTVVATGSTAPSGTVAFTNSGSVVCGAVPLQPVAFDRSTATCAFMPAPGRRQVGASYSGDGVFLPAEANLALFVAGDAASEVPLLSPSLIAVLSLLLAVAAVGAPGAMPRRRSRT